MKRLCLALAVALALPAAATGATVFGAAEDGPKFAEDGGVSLFADMSDIGLEVDRVSVLWDPSDPFFITRRAGLNRMVAAAAKQNIRVVFSVYPATPRAIASTPGAPGRFATFLQLLARAYPQVDEYIVGNEPNQPRFWQPQFDGRCRNASAAAYETLLARSYDALKAVSPTITVVGAALSPRGNDNCHASDNVSTSPVRFIAALGAAYRASGRLRPLMDLLGFHPYPNPQRQTDSPSVGYQWPNAGVPNLDRIEQAFEDAFAGTRQRTFTRGLKFVLDEVGWQATISPALAPLYDGFENVKTVAESMQARYYAEVVRRFTCDPAVDSVFFFHLVDEADLDRFQSGLERVDRSHRPSYDAVKATLAQTGGRCLGSPVRWRPATGVAAAWAHLSATWLAFGADEDATATIVLLRIPTRALGGGRVPTGATVVASMQARVRAYLQSRRRAVLPTGEPGVYIYQVTLRAAANPRRRTVFLSRPLSFPG